jgi:hypothetical protein
MVRAVDPYHAAQQTAEPHDHGGCMTRAIETLISAWVAEQERERVRLRAEPDGPVPPQVDAQRNIAQAEPGARDR